MKSVLTLSTAVLMLAAAPVLAEQPSSPGAGGQTKAFSSAGFGVAAAANGKGNDHAASVFGNNGKGNGAEPAAGEPDHDPNNFGGEPDITR